MEAYLVYDCQSLAELFCSTSRVHATWARIGPCQYAVYLHR